MLSLVLWFGALASLLAVPSTATCNPPQWIPLHLNPLTRSDGSPITSSPNNQVKAVTRSVGGGDGLDFMAQSDTGTSEIGDYSTSTTEWTTFPGYTDSAFTDFHWVNWNATRRGLFYMSNTTLYVVLYDPTTNQWSDNKLLVHNAKGFPQAVVVGDKVIASVQQIGGRISVGISTDGMETFTNNGHARVSNQPILPEGQYTMFVGNLDGGSDPVLWFYWIDKISALPNIAYSTDYTAGNVELSTPQAVGYVSLYKSTSVTAIASVSHGQILLLRTGYATSTSSASYTYYTIIKMKSGPITQMCQENLIYFGLSQNIQTVWSPAVTLAAIGSDIVTLNWVNNSPLFLGDLMALYSVPWQT